VKYFLKGQDKASLRNIDLELNGPLEGIDGSETKYNN